MRMLTILGRSQTTHLHHFVIVELTAPAFLLTTSACRYGDTYVVSIQHGASCDKLAPAPNPWQLAALTVKPLILSLPSVLPTAIPSVTFSILLLSAQNDLPISTPGPSTPPSTSPGSIDQNGTSPTSTRPDATFTGTNFDSASGGYGRLLSFLAWSSVRHSDFSVVADPLPECSFLFVSLHSSS